MPTYEYACSSCDTTHDIVQKMTDPTLTECPECGEPTLRKVFNGVGVVFKGSGFYRNDSREASKSAAGKTSDSKSESTGKSDSGDKKSSDSKSTESSSKSDSGKKESSSKSSASPANAKSS